MYFGLIYDSRAKTPLTEETKDIFVTDIRNKSRIKAEQNRDVLTLTGAFYSNQVLLFLTKRSSSYINITCCQIKYMWLKNRLRFGHWTSYLLQSSSSVVFGAALQMPGAKSKKIRVCYQAKWTLSFQLQLRSKNL